jgi:hypothetical protein
MKNWTIFLAALTVSATVHAGGPCQGDIEKFCSSVPRGRAQAKCLSEHHAELSSACQEKYKGMMGRMRHTYEACQEDAEKFCSDVQPGAGALPKCLMSHKQELSKACQDVMKGPQGKSRKKK